MPQPKRRADGTFDHTGSGIPASGVEASGYKWEQFEAGNLVPLHHGARSPRFVDPVAAELAEALLDDRPDLAGYPEAVAAWARHETMVLLYSEYHARLGSPFDEDGNVIGGGYYFTAEKAAQRMRERLGLDPRADAELQSARAQVVHLVADLEAIRARGRAVIEQRRAELGVAPGSAQLAAGRGSVVAEDDDTSESGNGAQGSWRRRE